VHIRFDDPTVSRRHALVYRDEYDSRVLDDRSVNGMFRKGERGAGGTRGRRRHRGRALPAALYRAATVALGPQLGLAAQPLWPRPDRDSLELAAPRKLGRVLQHLAPRVALHPLDQLDPLE
jgi:pSer/pThr/pTyr-binding forkhead associated (FHA) protein